MNSTQQIKIGAVISYCSIAINIATGLLYTPWVISSIGRENFGLYTLAMSVMSLFVFDFGLSSAITRFIAKYMALGSQDKANDCVGLTFRLYLSIDIVMLFVLTSVYFFIPYIYKQLTPDEISKFEIIYIVAALYSILSFPFIPLNGILNAHEKFIQVKLCDVVHKLIIVALMSICLIFGYGLYALVIVNAISGILTIVLKLLCIAKYTKQRINLHYFEKAEFKSLISFSGWTTVIALSQRCIFSIAPSILGYYSGSVAIAILGIATTIEGYTFTLANALNGMFLPKVSRIYVKDNGNILPLMVKIGRIQLYIVGFIVLGVIFLGREFINLWVGADFRQSYLCAVLLIIPSFFHLPQMIGNEAIYATNKVKKLSIIYILMAIINIVGAILLTPYWGSIGVCFSICIAYLVRTVGMDIIFYKDIKIDVLSFFKNCYLKLMPAIFLCIVIGLLLGNLLESTVWSTFFVKCLLFGVLYFVIMYFLGMNKSEKDLVFGPIKRIFKL